jgi:spermidine synthase
VRRLRKVLPQVHVYLAPVPTYPSGLWSFVAASPTTDPSQPHPEAGVEGTRYYSPQVHRAAFVLPPFVVGALEEGEGR